MVFAADYPFMDVFWTMVVFFVFVAWLFVIVVLLTDIFRRRDISGWAKAAWTLFLALLPVVGVLTYLVTNHRELAARVVGESDVSRARVDYLEGTTNGPSAEIEKAKQLLDSGAITQVEFAAIKAKAIA